MKNLVQKLGQNLKRLREERGLSQVAVAALLKVNKSYVSNIEHGKSNPTLKTLEKLTVIFNISVSDILK